jgi:hypothetical protein
MASMRRLIAVAVVVAVGTVPVFAQRGGGSHGGSGGHGGGFASHGGGLASHSAPAFRGSAAPTGRPGYSSMPRLSVNRTAGVSANPMAGRGTGVADYHRRPIYYPGGAGYRRPYVPAYGVGLPYAYGSTWLGPDCFDITDCSYYDDPAYGSQAVAPEPPADYPQEQVAPPPVQYAPPVDQAEAVPPGAFRPAYEKPQPEPQAEAAVTLVYRDGRPNEEIHNYMLTRTMLYVQDEHHRAIPVADLDLAATAKVNKDAGVDFQLPGGGS